MIDMVCNQYSALCFRVLDMLNLIWLLDFRLKPIFATVPAASTNITHFKSGLKWLKNYHLGCFIKVNSESLKHTPSSAWSLGFKRFDLSVFDQTTLHLTFGWYCTIEWAMPKAEKALILLLALLHTKVYTIRTDSTYLKNL